MKERGPVPTFAAALLGALALLAAGGATLAGCHPALPTRFVLERDFGDWSYRRYQRVLDVDFPVEGNEAVGHTATYLYGHRRGGRIIHANAVVSRYDHAAGLGVALREQLHTLSSYELRVEDHGGHGYLLDGGPEDRWFVWLSGAHIIKIGGGAEEPPWDVVSEYMSLYPSDLDEHGRAREDSPGAAEDPRGAPTSGGAEEALPEPSLGGSGTERGAGQGANDE